MEYINELLHTPEVLEQAMAEGPEDCLLRAPELVFCGCGTSYYLCAQMAKLCVLQGKAASAVEAAELLDGAALPGCAGAVYVFLSRSGRSMETVLAQELVRNAGYETFYLGCTAGSPLERRCGGARVLPYGAERLTLESYSSTAQFLCLARCCGLAVSPDAPKLVRKALETADTAYRRVEGTWFRRLICLGTPFYMPLLRELMLKSGELTQLPSEAWGLLEFRHGPRSWADEGCLITAVPGVRTLEYDRRAGAELVEYGCKVLWCGPEPPEGAVPIALKAARRSVEECLALTAFQTGLAAAMGRAYGVDAAYPRHVVHNVDAL